MKYVEAFSKEFQNEYVPNKFLAPHELSLFLGGGISNTADWQQKIVELLKDINLVLLNPRRQVYIESPETAMEQIKWEFRHLERADIILFWFSPETLCPITLFEYGKWLVQQKPLVVGCHPDYKRILDVRVQTELVRPNLKVCTSLEEMVEEIKKIVP